MISYEVYTLTDLRGYQRSYQALPTVHIQRVAFTRLSFLAKITFPAFGNNCNVAQTSLWELYPAIINLFYHDDQYDQYDNQNQQHMMPVWSIENTSLLEQCDDDGSHGNHVHEDYHDHVYHNNHKHQENFTGVNMMMMATMGLTSIMLDENCHDDHIDHHCQEYFASANNMMMMMEMHGDWIHDPWHDDIMIIVMITLIRIISIQEYFTGANMMMMAAMGIAAAVQNVRLHQRIALGYNDVDQWWWW